MVNSLLRKSTDFALGSRAAGIGLSGKGKHRMENKGPLRGLKIVEFAGIGPAPYAGQLLADLGADVVVIDRPERGEIGLPQSVDRRGKRSIVVDLKKEAGRAVAAQLAAWADVLIEGNRPGVMERLGLGPEVLMATNPALVYARMTGWGQAGPRAMQAGHDINYLSITGALHAIGDADRPPPPPLNLVGDFGGGSMFLIMGILAALYAARATGKGQVVDAAIVDGVNSMMGMFHGLHAAGGWTPARQRNWLDGGVPYYRCYGTSDGEYMAVGPIEPQFLALMLEGLEIPAAEYGDQNDPAEYPRQVDLLTRVFAGKTRDDWSAIFAGTDACVTPVLRYDEVATHPHMAARGAITVADGLPHPARAPVLAGHGAPATDIPADGRDTVAVLQNAGMTKQRIAELLAAGVIRQA